MRVILILFFCIGVLATLAYSQDSPTNTTSLPNTPQVQNSPNLQSELESQPQTCAHDCTAQSISNPSSDIQTVTIFVMVCLAVLVLAGLVTVLLCTNRRIARCTKKLCRRNKMMLAFRQKYDVISAGVTSQVEFQQRVKNIVGLFQKSIQKQVFGYKTQNEQSNHFSKATLILKKQNDFHYMLEIEGEDHLGEWSGNGSILCHNSQTLIWFTHEYYDVSARYKEDLKIFLSCQTSSEVVTGRWYASKEQPVREMGSGVWILAAGAGGINGSVSSQRLDSMAESQL